MKIIKIFLILLCFLTAINVVRADFDIAKWQFKKDILISPKITRESFIELALDNEIFEKANQDLSDIRIIHEKGEEIPYFLTIEAPKSERENFSAKIFNKGSVDENFTIFTVDVGKEGALHNQIEINTDSKNFRREIAIEASQDQITWAALDSNKYIYDYTFEFKAHDTLIKYPETAFRYLRVKIFDKGELPLNIIGVEMRREIIKEGKQIFYQGDIISQIQDQENKASIVIMDLGAKGLSTNKLNLKTEDSNFNREVALEGGNDLNSWSIISFRDLIFNYQTPKFNGSKLHIDYPEKNFRYLRLTIFNKDDKPINIKTASISGFLRKIVFSAKSGDDYMLYYGNQSARSSTYDLKNYIDYFNQSDRHQASLSSEMPNESYQPEKPSSKSLNEKYPNILLAVLIIASAVIGFLFFKLLKKI